MSSKLVINTGLRRRLYNDAQAEDEYATTRLWEYLLQEPFSSDNWVRASQQPVTPHDNLRRVDLVIEHLDLKTGVGSKVLIVEAKKHSATNLDKISVEGQAWEACDSYSNGPRWFLTCVGTTARIWMYDPSDILPIAFMPGAFGLKHMDHPGQYLDIAHAEYGPQIMKALRFIRDNHQPPRIFLDYASPSIPSTESSDQSQSPQTLELQAAAQILIPLDQKKWKEIRIERNDGSNIFAVTVGSRQEHRFATTKKDWRLQPWGPPDSGDVVYAHIEQGSRRVFWVRSLEVVAADSSSQQQSPWQSGQIMNVALSSTSQQQSFSMEDPDSRDSQSEKITDTTALDSTSQQQPFSTEDADSRDSQSEKITDTTALDSTSQQQPFSTEDADSRDWQLGKITDTTALNSTSHQQPASQEPAWIKVKVKVHERQFHKNIWEFQDIKSHSVKKEWVDWKVSRHPKDGRKVHTYVKKGITYYTRQFLD